MLYVIPRLEMTVYEGFSDFAMNRSCRLRPPQQRMKIAWLLTKYAMPSSFRRRPESSDVSFSTPQAFLDPGFHREDDGPMFLHRASESLFSYQETDSQGDKNTYPCEP